MDINRSRLVAFIFAVTICTPVLAQWKYDVGEDSMTDKKMGAAYAFSSDGRGKLWIECYEDGPISVRFNRLEGWTLSHDFTHSASVVRYRVDKNNVVVVSPRTLYSNRRDLQLARRNGQNWKRIVKNMRAGNMLTVDASTSLELLNEKVKLGLASRNHYDNIARGNHTFRHSFSLAGFTKQYAQACQWHPDFD